MPLHLHRWRHPSSNLLQYIIVAAHVFLLERLCDFLATFEDIDNNSAVFYFWSSEKMWIEKQFLQIIVFFFNMIQFQNKGGSYKLLNIPSIFFLWLNFRSFVYVGHSRFILTGNKVINSETNCNYLIMRKKYCTRYYESYA